MSDTEIPDPRWPLLDRWSTKAKSCASSPVSSTVKIQSSLEGPDASSPRLSSPIDGSDQITEISPPAITGDPQTTSPQARPGDASEQEIVTGTGAAFPNRSIAHSSPILKGAWAVPLNIQAMTNNIPAPTCNEPSLENSRHAPRSFRKFPREEAGGTIPEGSSEDVLRFPWAAKMDPSARNLYRATVPDFMEDGTPKEIIKNDTSRVMCLSEGDIATSDSGDSDSDEEVSVDFVTPSGNRFLRDRPVKPSTKAKEMQWQPSEGGRG